MIEFEYDPLKKLEDAETEELSKEWHLKALEEIHEKNEWRQRDIEALRQIILGTN